jgi:hypothetical protein
VRGRDADEGGGLVRSAKESPESPIILDAYGPLAYEAVTSLSYYIPALGATNRIAVRFHADETLKGTLYDGLQQSFSRLQEADNGPLAPGGTPRGRTEIACRTSVGC